MSRTVVSLTTSPYRIEFLRPVIDALLETVDSLDALYLDLPMRYRNRETYHLPDWLCGESQVTLLRPAEDLGPVMKILPVLEVETDPVTVLITVDDDVVYPDDGLKVLMRASVDRPDAAHGGKGFNFSGDGLHIEPIRGAQACQVLQGYGACAYRRGHFDLDRLNATLAAQPEALRFSDDVLLSNHIAGQGVPRYTISMPVRLQHMAWGDEDPQALKYKDGGTHRRYDVLRRWLKERDEWHL